MTPARKAELRAICASATVSGHDGMVFSSRCEEALDALDEAESDRDQAIAWADKWRVKAEELMAGLESATVQVLEMKERIDRGAGRHGWPPSK